MNTRPRLREHMLAVPPQIDLDASLSAADEVLRHSRVDRAPVYEDGRLCGILREQAVGLAKHLSVSLHDLTVRNMVLDDVYIASKDAPLQRVARMMALQNVETALIRNGECVVGLLRLRDVVTALVGQAADQSTELGPSEVREAILIEHENIRRLLARVETFARALLKSPVPSARARLESYEATKTLVNVTLAHIELENRLLAPALESLDAWGSVRADRLRAEHHDQSVALRSLLAKLEREYTDHEGRELATLAYKLVESLRADMAMEEECLLREDLLCDVPPPSTVELG